MKTSNNFIIYVLHKLHMLQMIGEVYTNTKIYKDYKMKKITGKEYIKIRTLGV